MTLLINRTSVPVNQIVKEMLYEEPMQMSERIRLADQQRTSVLVQDAQGRMFKIWFFINKRSNQSGRLPMEREGKRFLVGKFAVLDKKNLVRVKAVNRNGTFDIVGVNDDREMKDVSEARLLPIERYGVNTYDLQAQPF